MSDEEIENTALVVKLSPAEYQADLEAARAEGRREALDAARDAPLEGRRWRNQGEYNAHEVGLKEGRSAACAAIRAKLDEPV